MLKDMISIATQWQSVEDALAQIIIDNEMSEDGREPEEANDNPNLHIITQTPRGHPDAKMNTTDHAQGVRQQGNYSTIGKTALNK